MLPKPAAGVRGSDGLAAAASGSAQVSGEHRQILRAVGGSVFVTLPRQLLRDVGLAAGASVVVTVEDGRLVLSPARPRYTLAELLVGMKPGDMPTAPGWGDARPTGREAW